MIDRVVIGFERTAAFAAAVSLALACLAMLGQVAARYVFGAPIVWAEEFAVLLFAWITFLGAAVVQAEDSHLSIDVLRARLGPRFGRVLDGLRRLVIVVCSGVIAYQGVMLSQRMWGLEFPAMGVSRGLLYASVPAGFLLSLLFALRARAGAPRQDATSSSAH